MTRDKKVLYSHQTDEHITPPEVIERLARTFKIQYDPCPSPHYIHPQFEKENDRRAKEGTNQFARLLWPNCPIFINPPYSEIDDWVDKALYQFDTYPNKPIVMLLPSRTDRPWFEKIFDHAHAIGFKRLRYKFMQYDRETGNLKVSRWAAPFPSAFFILENNVSVFRNAEILNCLEDLDCVSLVLKDLIESEEKITGA